MKILGIESSCDDTSVALIEASPDSFNILAEKTASQIEIHKKYGGVVPEIAGRMHAEKIIPLVESVLTPLVPLFEKEGGCSTLNVIKPDVIAVTSGPGLITGLLVGVEAAKSLSYLWKVPIVAVNHIEGHIHSVEIQSSNLKTQKIEYPALALIASGGHTELIYIKNQGKYKKIGATVDDASGECFDKVAKLLNFEYPGGPKISKHAENGNTTAINFPRPMLAPPKHKNEGGLKENNFNFSFAGLKTSALYWLRDNKLSEAGDLPTPNPYLCGERGVSTADFCASFEQAIIDVLVGKTIKAAEKYKPKTIILGGGVAANKKLRETLAKKLETLNLELKIPSLKYCMDNATMIAVAGYYKAVKKQFTPWQKIHADPNWEL